MKTEINLHALALSICSLDLTPKAQKHYKTRYIDFTSELTSEHTRLGRSQLFSPTITAVLNPEPVRPVCGILPQKACLQQLKTIMPPSTWGQHRIPAQSHKAAPLPMAIPGFQIVRENRVNRDRAHGQVC